MQFSSVSHKGISQAYTRRDMQKQQAEPVQLSMLTGTPLKRNQQDNSHPADCKELHELLSSR
jgi:hypothetical protein